MCPIPLQRWQTIPVVRPVEATEVELLAGACTLVDLLTSGACDGVGGAAERALLVEGAADRVAEGGTVLNCPGVDLGVDVLPKLFLGLCCRPCNSFSAKHASWNNLGTLSYSL